jgi:phage-related protein
MYGGTKEEMQRLLSDAEKLTGKKFDLSSYSDIVEAIHAVQTEMGITGTTTKEASTTIQGSVSSAKSAWQNLLVGIADDNQDFGKLVDNFVDSVATAAGNILPRVEQSLTGIVQLVDKLAPVIIEKLPDVINKVLPGLLDAAANLVGSVIDAIPALISGLLPTLLSALSGIVSKLMEAATQAILALAQTLSDPASLNAMIESALDLVLALVHGLYDALPQIIAAAPKLVGAIVTTIITELPNILAAAVEIMVALIHGLMEALPELMAYVPNIIISITNGLLNNLGTLISGGIQLLLAIAQGMIQAIPDMVAMIPRIIASIVDTFRSYNWSGIGKNIVAGMKQGVANAWKNFREWFKNLFGDLTNIAKKILGIASPSKVFKKIGQFTTEGLAIGIEQGGKDAFSAIKDVSQGVIDNYGASVSAGFGVSVGASASKGVSLTLNIDTFNNYTQEDIKSLAERLSEMLANAAERKAGAYA